MQEHRLEDEFTSDRAVSKNADQPRALTHDEKKAAEAAFRGDPFNPAWSVAAANVYAGIQWAMGTQPPATDADYDRAVECSVGQ